MLGILCNSTNRSNSATIDVQYSILNVAPLLGYGENTSCLEQQIWIFGTPNLY